METVDTIYAYQYQTILLLRYVSLDTVLDITRTLDTPAARALKFTTKQELETL